MSKFRRGEHKPVKTGRAARTRVGTYNSPERRRDVLTRLTVRVNAAAGVLTVADVLRERGADADLVKRYASPVGRKTAAAWRQATGTEPQQAGLAVAGRRLVRASAYSAADRPMLDAVIDGYEMRDPAAPKSGKAARVRLVDLLAPSEAPAPVEGTVPAVLVAELAERHQVAAGFVAVRVEAILAGMRSNPKLYNAQHVALTSGGTAVVRSVLFAEHTDGMLYREAEAWQDEQRPAFGPGARVSLLVSDQADPVTGTVRAIERNAIGLDVAEVALPGGRTTHQVTRFLTAA